MAKKVSKPVKKAASKTLKKVTSKAVKKSTKPKVSQDYPHADEKWEILKIRNISKPEKFQVSNYGRIRRWKPSVDDWRILKTANIKGYVYYSFKAKTHWSEKVSRCVHRLVAEYFCKKEGPSKRFVIHLDYKKDNNYYKNLKWVSKDEMYLHQQKDPDYDKKRLKLKGRITNSKVTPAQVVRMKKKLKAGEVPLYKIAREFGITHTQLNRIKRGENWGHIKI